MDHYNSQLVYIRRKPMNSVLWLCKGNTCRSPMGEALLKKALADEEARLTGLGLENLRVRNIRVESAGTYVGVNPDCLNSPAAEHSIECMRQVGLDIQTHKSRPLSVIDLDVFDLIVCVDQETFDFIAKQRFRGAVMTANSLRGGIPNPWQKGMPAYQKCAKLLTEAVRDIIHTYFS